jgi:hypothetical protein
MSWATQHSGSELDEKVCREKLLGARKITSLEGDDPVLLGLKGIDVCGRRGPLSFTYWGRLAKDVWTTVLH